MKNRIRFYIVVLFVPAVLIVLSLIAVLQKGLVVFPGKRYNAGVYSDTSSKVFSFDEQDERIELDYMLSKDKQYPFAGIYINILESIENRFLDISGYHSVEIKINATTSRDLRLFLLFYIENFTNRINYQSYRYLEQNIVLTGDDNTFSFLLENFETSLWWYSSNDTSEEELGKPDLKNLARIQIENGVVLPPVEKRDKIILEYLAFKRSYMGLYVLTGVSLLLAFMILITHWALKRNQKTVITYKPLELEDPLDSDTRKVVHYITNNYSNSELGMEMVCGSTGISTSKISSLLKRAYNLSFKQFLNSIRLAEAKRLLLETDYQIIEIAFKVGYNTVPHFNRLFKSIEGISPKEYRKQNHK